MNALRFAAVIAFTSLAFAQAPAKKSVTNAAEQRTAKYFESIKNDPLALRQFLYNLPKGGDLHNHVSGAIYAESFIQWAAEDGWCIEKATLNIVRPKASPIDAARDAKPACDKNNERPATDALGDPAFYTELVDAMSIRNWNPALRSGQAQFFATFGRFGNLAASRLASTFVESRRRSAAQNLHYLELIAQLDEARALIQAPQKLQWKQNGDDPDFAAMHHQLAADGLFTEKRSALLDKAEAAMDQTLKCGQPKAEKACEVPLRYQCQVLRAFSKESVFSQIAFCFELANSDPRVVTLNLVQPEDWLVPVRDFDLHMRMIDYFHQQFPKVQITLHAGELGFGQVPPDVLGYHIPKSIDMGHAQRIGHGTDVMYNPHAQDILHEMAIKKVAVEVSPSSSKYILGLTGNRHPFRQYLKAGVPVAIATDDEGVSRSDITNEYQQAVEQHVLTYPEIKKISMDSLGYGFLDAQQKTAAMAKLKQAFVEYEKNY
ncbi:MAG TPA: hypothetical protein VM009_03990 [Terriglobales bacterium]|nr:hypothetical protein [Terriglobales bacterium]